MLPSGSPSQFLNGLLVAQMRGFDTNSPNKSGDLSAEAGILELHHSHGQILRLIESCSASIDIDHELLPSRPDRRVEAFPCLETSAETDGPNSARFEEEPVTTDHHTLAGGAVRKRGENQIERGNNRQDFVGSILTSEET